MASGLCFLITSSSGRFPESFSTCQCWKHTQHRSRLQTQRLHSHSQATHSAVQQHSPTRFTLAHYSILHITPASAKQLLESRPKPQSLHAVSPSDHSSYTAASTLQQANILLPFLLSRPNVVMDSLPQGPQPDQCSLRAQAVMDLHRQVSLGDTRAASILKR